MQRCMPFLCMGSLRRRLLTDIIILIRRGRQYKWKTGLNLDGDIAGGVYRSFFAVIQVNQFRTGRIARIFEGYGVRIARGAGV